MNKLLEFTEVKFIIKRTRVCRIYKLVFASSLCLVWLSIKCIFSYVPVLTAVGVTAFMLAK
jgi:hypothetical protein